MLVLGVRVRIGIRVEIGVRDAWVPPPKYEKVRVRKL